MKFKSIIYNNIQYNKQYTIITIDMSPDWITGQLKLPMTQSKKYIIKICIVIFEKQRTVLLTFALNTRKSETKKKLWEYNHSP